MPLPPTSPVPNPFPPDPLPRRAFLQRAAAAAAALAAGAPALAACHAAPRGRPALPTPRPERLPRWRGFNLLEKFDHRAAAPYREADFQMAADWGFDFVRLPFSYRCWSTAEDPYTLAEAQLAEVDQAVRLGQRYGVHVNLAMHRAPGYCVNPPAEPRSLWDDPRALDAFGFQWETLARRYRAEPAAAVSFDLLNEPAGVEEPTYVRVVTHALSRIRAESPGRLVVADGLQYGRTPVLGLVGLGVAQSTRGYDPMPVTHAGASWVPNAGWPPPTWPLVLASGDRYDARRFREDVVAPWRALAARGVGVHVGEWGVYNRTPHAVALAYMRDLLALWKEAGWGWALWNLRGAFGVLDSERADVRYEPFRGHQLDRAMLRLLHAG